MPKNWPAEVVFDCGSTNSVFSAGAVAEGTPDVTATRQRSVRYIDTKRVLPMARPLSATGPRLNRTV